MLFRSINNFKKFVNSYNLITAHNFVHHPSFMHVSLLPDELKNDLMADVSNLTDYERNRLISELYVDKNDENYQKFIKFIKILDIKRNVNISDFLPEWKKYFD